MNELQKYKVYFQRVYIFFFLFSFLGGIVGGLIWFFYPEEFRLRRIWEMEYANGKVEERVLLTDQAVAIARSDEMRRIYDGEGVEISFFKPGPLTFELIIVTKDKSKDLIKVSDNISAFLMGRFPLKVRGEVLRDKYKPNFFYFLIGGLVTGIAVASLTTFTINYIKSNLTQR